MFLVFVTQRTKCGRLNADGFAHHEETRRPIEEKSTAVHVEDPTAFQLATNRAARQSQQV